MRWLSIGAIFGRMQVAILWLVAARRGLRVGDVPNGRPDRHARQLGGDFDRAQHFLFDLYALAPLGELGVRFEGGFGVFGSVASRVAMAFLRERAT